MKELDYKFKGKPRIKCPKCGKLGTKRHYESGKGYNVFHKYYIGMWGIPTITKMCYMKLK